jgi:hypothetical protein
MKIYKKNKRVEHKAVDAMPTPTEVNMAKDATPEEMDETTIQFTEEEIMTLKDVLPKIVQLLTGEATIELIEDEEDMDMEEEAEDMEEVEDMEEAEEDIEVEILEPEMEKEAEDEAPFDAMAVLNDPKKKAALIEALKGQKTAPQKVGDMMEPKAEDMAYDMDHGMEKAEDKPAKKVFVKKTLPKKAGDEQPVVKKPNSELVKTPVVRKVGDSSTTTVRTFNFHKTREN